MAKRRSAADWRKAVEKNLLAWAAWPDGPELVRQAEALPVRRDMVTLLTFVRDNKVVGTQSTGNMPLKAIRRVTADFVRPVTLDTTIGDRVYKLRTEDDVWPLRFLHVVAEIGGLLVTPRGKAWRLTRYGRRFLTLAPAVQAAFMLTIWWYRTNWLIAYPVMGLGEHLPPYFSSATLFQLSTLPANMDIPYAEFADNLIKRSGLTWSSPDSTYALDSLHVSIRRMVMEILAEFEATQLIYQEKSTSSGYKFRELAGFNISLWGRQLLEALAIIRMA